MRCCCVAGFLEENATLLFCQLTGRSSPVTDSCMLDVRGRGAIAAVTMSVSQCRVTHFHTLLHPAFSCRGLVPTRWDITMLESGKGQQLQSTPHLSCKWQSPQFSESVKTLLCRFVLVGMR